MKNMKIYLAVIVLVLLSMMTLTVTAQADSAGNVFIDEDNAGLQTVQRDLYWAGSTRTFSGYQVGKSFLAAGYDITVSDTEVGGSLRIGAYSIVLNGIDVEDNITAAANEIQMSGVTASGVYAAGNSVYFSGSADRVILAASKVTIDGEISGDVDVYAEKIIIGDDLKVNGTLTVHSENEPVMPSGAVAGKYVFNKTETETSAVTDDNNDGVSVQVQASKKSSGFGSFIRGMFSTLLLAALIYLLLGGNELSKPGEMLLSRPLPMLGTGLAGLFVIPGVTLILLFIWIGFPSAGLIAILFLIVCLFSLTFAGMTVGKTLIPRFVNSSITNKDWFCLLIGALVFWLLRKIPFIGGLLQACAIIYTLGYFLQTIYLRLKESKNSGVKGNLNTAPQNDVLQPVAAGTAAAESVATDAPKAEDLPEAVSDGIAEEAASHSADDNDDPLQGISE